MKKIIFIPDSFKGTLSSSEICTIMNTAAEKVCPDAKTVQLPVADGGEGSVDAFLTAMSGTKHTVMVKGPYNEEIEAFYGVIKGNTAVIEMAAAAGLPLVKSNLNPELTSTFGVGQLIKKALEDENITQIILGLGGSATNDAGCGMAAALGVNFYDKNNISFIPVGKTLCNVARIDLDGLNKRVNEVEISVMCDIDNTVCGQQGAAAVFGPQKGADPEMVKRLDAGLLHLTNVIKENLNIDVLSIKGGGAAGGMGAGAVAFLNGRLSSGIDIMLDVLDFEQIIKDADVIFTGEGRIDGQSLRGKVVVGVARRAKSLKVPVIAVVGDIADNAEESYNQGVTAIFSINRRPMEFEKAKAFSHSNLYLTMVNILRSIKYLH